MDKDLNLKLQPNGRVSFHEFYSIYRENLATGETLLTKRSFHTRLADFFKIDKVGGQYRVHGLAFTKTLRPCY